MKAILIEKPGDPNVLKWEEVALPEPAEGEVRVEVKAAGVNQADVMQRQGHYPAPPGCPADIPGIEFAGVIDEVGPGTTGFKKGDSVFGLIGGGAYAQYVIVNAQVLTSIPNNLDFVQAAAMPEAFITAYDALVTQCQLKGGEHVLINAVGSSVGIAAVQIAKVINAVSIGTSRTADKIEKVRAFGLDFGIVPTDGAFAEAVLNSCDGKGVDVVLELVGGNYVQEDLRCLNVGGRLVLVGLLGGRKIDIDLSKILTKRLIIRGTTLRSRSLSEKIAINNVFAQQIVPLIEKGICKPVIDKVFPITEAAKAHKYMESHQTFGKIILQMN